MNKKLFTSICKYANFQEVNHGYVDQNTGLIFIYHEKCIIVIGCIDDELYHIINGTYPLLMTKNLEVENCKHDIELRIYNNMIDASAILINFLIVLRRYNNEILEAIEAKIKKNYYEMYREERDNEKTIEHSANCKVKK